MKRLYDLDPNEVSLVPRGANRKKFLIYKSLKGKEMAQTSLKTLVQSVDPKILAKVERVVKSMKMKKAKAMPEVTDSIKKEPEGDQLSERAQAALKAVARILAPFKDEISDDHLDAVQGEVGIKPGMGEHAEKDMDGGEVEMSMEAPEGVDGEHHGEAMAHANKAYMSHLEKLGYQKYPEQQPKVGSEDGVMKEKMHNDLEEDDDDEEEEGVSKVQKSGGTLDLSAFPQGQRAQLQSIFKSHQDLVQKNADLEKELKLERDFRVTKEFEDKAKSFRHLGSNSKELAKVMKSLGESNPEVLTQVEAVLKSADEQLRVAALSGGTFREIGSRQSGDAMDPLTRLDAMVDERVAKSEGKTREQVYEDVLKSPVGKQLYRESQAARAGGV